LFAGWHDAHDGGFAIPFGPCARWQLAQSRRPWPRAAWPTWQLAHVALVRRFARCGSWQLTQTWCPRGAELACAA
jgi:hypothetical protein